NFERARHGDDIIGGARRIKHAPGAREQHVGDILIISGFDDDDTRAYAFERRVVHQFPSLQLDHREFRYVVTTLDHPPPKGVIACGRGPSPLLACLPACGEKAEFTRSTATGRGASPAGPNRWRGPHRDLATSGEREAVSTKARRQAQLQVRSSSRAA